MYRCLKAYEHEWKQEGFISHGNPDVVMELLQNLVAASLASQMLAQIYLFSRGHVHKS